MSNVPLTPNEIQTLLSLGGGSGPNAAANPMENPEAFEFFAFVVDGAVDAIFIASKETMQNYINAWSSNPITVKLTAEQKNVVQVDWSYDAESGSFTESA